ncbi:MAG: phosphoglucosamine mutase, partial [Spirochaetales bacterium]|nr:phosphoglucosamine mutase [Spirochaetales bacterium]
MGNSFGVSGLRGEANVSLTADITYKFGKLLGWYLRKLGTRESQVGRPKVVIGRDPRQSGAMFESSISAGLMESGADAYLLHVTSTPSVSFITR